MKKCVIINSWNNTNFIFKIVSYQLLHNEIRKKRLFMNLFLNCIVSSIIKFLYLICSNLLLEKNWIVVNERSILVTSMYYYYKYSSISQPIQRKKDDSNERYDIKWTAVGFEVVEIRNINAKKNGIISFFNLINKT